MKSKLLYPGGWIRVRPMLNQHFPTPDPRCRLCLGASCAVAWGHIPSGAVVCTGCMRDVYAHGRDVAAALGLVAE